jgi:hypothetical protein
MRDMISQQEWEELASVVLDYEQGGAIVLRDGKTDIVDEPSISDVVLGKFGSINEPDESMFNGIPEEHRPHFVEAYRRNFGEWPPTPRFPDLPDGHYRYVRMRDGRVGWAFPNDNRRFHRDLVRELGIDPDTEDGRFKVLSAGFFLIKGGDLSIPQELPPNASTDEKNRTNRSIGLQRTTRHDDAPLIRAQLRADC